MKKSLFFASLLLLGGSAWGYQVDISNNSDSKVGVEIELDSCPDKYERLEKKSKKPVDIGLCIIKQITVSVGGEIIKEIRSWGVSGSMKLNIEDSPEGDYLVTLNKN